MDARMNVIEATHIIGTRNWDWDMNLSLGLGGYEGRGVPFAKR